MPSILKAVLETIDAIGALPTPGSGTDMRYFTVLTFDSKVPVVCICRWLINIRIESQ